MGSTTLDITSGDGVVNGGHPSLSEVAAYIQLLLAPEVSLSTAIVHPSQLKILLREVCLFPLQREGTRDPCLIIHTPPPKHSGGLFSLAGKGA